MSNFICTNVDCASFEQVQLIPEVYIKVKNGKVISLDKYKKEIVCAVCGRSMQYKREHTGFTVNVLTFDGKTSQEKRAILKKRANTAFKKNIDGMRDYRDEQEIKSNKLI